MEPVYNVSQEKAKHRILSTRKERKLKNSNIIRKFQFGTFHHHFSIIKVLKSIEVAWMSPSLTTVKCNFIKFAGVSCH